MRVVLTLPAGAQATALAVALAMPHVTLRRRAIRGRGAQPVLMAMQAPGLATYLFHGLGPADADDIAATIRAYLAAPGGWIIDARGCGRLRLCLHSRVPAG